ncbi:hypothetical protein ACA910_015252 [Epithemia clementina (nom. ined.)]
MTPFQCEECHFENFFWAATKEAAEDKWVIICIVRANIDAFWAQRPSTVRSNLLEVTRMMEQARIMRIDQPIKAFPRGPFPLNDSLGMVSAILSLHRSLDKGKNSKTIQWDTMRGLHSAYSNLVHTTPLGTAAAVLSDSRKTTRITNSPTNGIWFQRFMKGSHERMGDVRIPDTALTIDVLRELDLLLETG